MEKTLDRVERTMDRVETRVTQLASSTIRRAPQLGRKITRRLSLVTRVPSLLTNRNYLVTGSRESIRIRPPRPRKVRSFHVAVVLPDQSQRTLVGDTRQTVRELVSHVLLEFGVSEPLLRLGDSGAEADPAAAAALLEGETLIVEEARTRLHPRAETDARYALTAALLETERRYLASVKAVEQIFGTPLRKLSSITPEDHRQLFTGVQPVCSVSSMLINKLECTLAAWDQSETRVGGLFSKQLLAQYEDYKEFYGRAKELLREKQTTDEEFVEFCKLRRGAAKHNLDALLYMPVQRLAQYERYFRDLLSETSAEHPDAGDLTRLRARVTQLASTPTGDLSELDRIQDLFPSDSLGLHGRDPTSQRMKGLMRKRSAPATRLQRALSSKSLRVPSAERSVADEVDTMPPPDTVDSPGKRHFVMETAVQFSMGLQSQERHLFLFSDMLLVAKARSGGNFKLKEKVRLSEMWLASCLDEVTEVTKDPSTSFVMGWPTTNVVATFSFPSTRDLWYNKLNQMIADERETEAKATTIQVVFYDQVNNIDFCKTLSVGASQPARDCVRLALTSLEMGSASAADYRLWVRTGLEDAPYPLIGHELPFAIKMNFVREFLPEDGVEMDHCNNVYATDPSLKCQFVLRHARKNCLTPSPDAAKKKKALKKSPIRIHKVFRRVNSKSDSLDSAASSPGGGGSGGGLLFGQPLTRLCERQPMPKPIMEILIQLFLKGPFTVGIFRKSANARVVKEMREKLDSELEVHMETVNVYVLAALLKEFIRSLPEALLGSELYEDWREVAEIEDRQDRLMRVRELCKQLPAAHITLLCHLLCVLHHIARRSHHNLMSAANLAVCVGPSLLAPADPARALAAEAARLLPAVVELLVDQCAAVFGPEVLTLFGAPPERELRADSGAEESDSLHSSGGVRRDDSSIDSLERELLGENEPLPRKDKMAATNLSRDSGLTLSDTQLYAPDDEESESSSHSGEKSASVYSSGRGSDAGCRHYPAPADPAAIYAAVCRRQLAPALSSPATAGYRAHSPAVRLNSNFQRQDWTRQHHPLRRAGGFRAAADSRGPMRRSASEESLLNNYGGNAGGSGLSRSPAMDAPAPAARASASPPMVRSKSAHHIVEQREAGGVPLAPVRESGLAAPAGDWQRSRSTPHIDEVDRSYDSSTLSDDDSTPHVSRSNSRSKDCSLVTDLWERAYGTLDSRSDSGSHASRHSSFKSSRTGSFSTVRSTGTVRSVEAGTPPSYDATLGRRQWYQRSPASGSTGGVPEQLIREQTILSSRAKQLYAESLRIYAQQTAGPDMVRASPVRAVSAEEAAAAPPLPPKTEPPPLPPKQKTPLKRLNAAAATPSSGSRIKQLPPVHVNMSDGARRAAAGTGDQPPALPPKERTVIQINGSDTPARPQRPRRKVSKREVETQTEAETPESCVSAGSDDLWAGRPAPHVTLLEIEAPPGGGVPAPVGPSERRGRNRRRDRQALRSRSAGQPGTPECEPETAVEWSGGAESPAELRGEINWSVSRLRAMFSADQQGTPSGGHRPLQRTAAAAAAAAEVYSSLPAPRPARPGHRRSDSGGSSYGEESYV